MTREQYLNLLIRLSTLESLILANKAQIPEGMWEDMEQGTALLRKEVLK